MVSYRILIIWKPRQNGYVSPRQYFEGMESVARNWMHGDRATAARDSEWKGKEGQKSVWVWVTGQT